MPIPKGFETRYSEHEKRTVRESVATMSSITPIDTTASDNNAADIITLASTTPPAMNLVTNPRFEADTSGWTAVGSTITRQTTSPSPWNGAGRMRVVPDNSAAGEGAYFDLGATEPGSYAFSAYFRRASGSGDTVHIRASTDEGVTFTNGTTVTLGTSWTRSTLSFRVRGQPVTSMRIYVASAANIATTYYVDGVQVEPNWGVVMGYENGRDENSAEASPTDFIDPDANRYSRFLGTDDASVSVREPEIQEIHSFNLTVMTADAYIDFDRDATRSSVLVRAGDTITGKKITKQRISMINATDGQTPRVYGFVMGF